MDPMSRSITVLLELAREGDAAARRKLWDEVYRELHALAAAFIRRERGTATLQATVLIHDAYFKLFGRQPPDFCSSAEFFAAAANAMRQILIEHARKRAAAKRGAGARPVDFVEALYAPAVELDPEAGIALDEALTSLAAVHPRQARVVEMRFFGELSVRQTAEALGVSDRTVESDWRLARAWLFRELSGDANGRPD